MQTSLLFKYVHYLICSVNMNKSTRTARNTQRDMTSKVICILSSDDRLLLYMRNVQIKRCASFYCLLRIIRDCVFCQWTRLHSRCCSPLRLTEGKSSSQFPSTAVVRMKPRWDPLARGPHIRGLTALFQRRFFKDCPVPLGVSHSRLAS